MKIKKLFAAVTVSIAFVLGFTACLDGEGSKFNYTYYSPAVVDYNSEIGIFLRTVYGNFVPDSVSALSLAELSGGACISMDFEYNSEYQTDTYPIASGINYEVVQSDTLRYFSITEQTQEIIDSYNYPLSSVDLLSLSPNYQGIFFVETTAKLDKNQALEYYFYYNSDEPDENGAKNIYLQAKLPVTSTGSQNISELRALNVKNIIGSSGRDTTVYENGASYPLVYLKVNLKYCSEVEEDGSLVYKSASTQPFNIYVFKDDE
jgi:hypothetical protein